jgi:hypothetical protein
MKRKIVPRTDLNLFMRLRVSRGCLAYRKFSIVRVCVGRWRRIISVVVTRRQRRGRLEMRNGRRRLERWMKLFM